MEDNELLNEIHALRDELREYQGEVSCWRVELSQRVSSIETTIKPAIMGNGQPSRLASVESRVGELERGNWRRAGAYTVLSALAVVGWELIKRFLMRI